jgi:hypothetical protein
MIPAGISNHSAPAFFFAQVRNLVIGATQFEGADGLEVFEFEEKFARIRRLGPL